MKKILMVVTAAAFLVACGGKSTSTKTEDTNATQVEATTEAKEEVKEEGDVLSQYEALIEKAIEVYPKVKAGDATAVAEYQKIAEDMGALSTKLTEEMSTMTPEQANKFAELGQKLAAAMAQ